MADHEGMPADLAITLDPSVRVRRPAANRFPFPIPNGWFVVAEAADVSPGDVRVLSYFGRELVLFGTEAGEPRLVDAYCAHLGSHLGVGGRVEADGIRCPFHGWRYDGASGRCTDIPYSATGHIPTQARIRAYPTLVRNRMIWAWHHLEGGAPFYDVPTVEEFDDPEWSAPCTREYVVRTCCQEMAENNHDFAHFAYVHGTPDIPWDTEQLVLDQPYKRTQTPSGSFVRESFGLGLGVLRKPGTFVFLSSTTPIDEDNVHVRWTFVTPRSHGADSAREISERFLVAVSQDIPIWENKRYVERPILTRDEGGILAHRKWAEQFYSPTPSPAAPGRPG
jgi:phenylpropionate dioxygenase-like ring-hydroxylating dioxygenase large terminal subunit